MQKYLLKTSEDIHMDFIIYDYDVSVSDDGDCYDEENETINDDDADDFCE